MPADYDKIRRDNIVAYGEKTHHLSFLGRLYTDQTHFLFELLQNAEDAGADCVFFKLFKDRLEILHDGRPFNEEDVRGLCGVGEGTKNDDLTQIGKFGIGFKSVYACTRTPEVHSGGEDFKIENYVRPAAVPPKSVDKSWTTFFILPFNAEKITHKDVCDKISNGLCRLRVDTLLFLRNINKIKYQLPDSSSGVYRRKESQKGPAREVRVIHQVKGKDYQENWLVFERPVTTPEKSKTVCVGVSFQLGPAKKKCISKVDSSPLFVSFATEKETRFGFLLQGPYRTTPSRDNIPRDDPWNENLVKETAKLISGILPKIKDLGLLSVPFLEALPIRTEDFPEDGIFYPIVESIQEALNTEELLPADDGSFVSAANAVLARGARLRVLLNHDQLRLLLESTMPLKWLTEEITQDRTPDLRFYLTNVLDVKELTPEDFARKIDHSFLSKQEDRWFVDFYRYLLDREALWRKPNWKLGAQGILRSKPIIRLDNGSQVVPFEPEGTIPNAYLPPPGETNFPIVKRSLVEDADSKTFLKRLGLSEPNIFDYIIEKVLPKYMEEENKSISDKEHEGHIKIIVLAISSDSQEGRKRFIKTAKETPFLKAVNTSGDIELKSPLEIYQNSPKLQRYFSNSSTAWFLHESGFSEEVDEDMLCELGVADRPRKLPTTKGFPAEEKEDSTRGETIDNYDLDGLKSFLKTFQETTDFEEKKKSAFILWNFLHDYLEDDEHFFKAKYHWFFRTKKRKFFDPVFLPRLQKSKWIPTKNGTVNKPAKITKHELFDEFADADELVKNLGIIDEKAQQTIFGVNVSREDIELIKSHRDKFEEWKAEFSPHKKQPAFPTNAVPNPERRQEHLSEQLSHTPEKGFEIRERSVRTTSPPSDPIIWLRTQYTNENDQMVCQICKKEMPFRKNDGKHYFEKKEVLSRKHLPNEHHTQYLALCPLCAAKYQEFIIRDKDAMDRLKESIVNTNGSEISISLASQKTSIRFTDTHYHDLKLLFVTLVGRARGWSELNE